MERLETKRNTILYGGAFNPPTRAHQAILQACIDYAETIDADVWLLPSGDRRDKIIDTPRAMRVRLLHALTRDIVSRAVTIRIDTSELDRNRLVETFDTVLEMNDKHPDRHFIWVFGSDASESMLTWHRGDWLINNLSMLVVERPNAPIHSLGRYATLLPVNTGSISSTEVRECINHGREVDHLVTPSVAKVLDTA